MDILSHGLWGLVYAKAMNQRPGRQTPLKLGWATFWGAFPDLIAFGPSFVWLGYALLTGEHTLNDLPFGNGHRPGAGTLNQIAMFQIANSIYNVSHSMVMFFSILFGVLIVRTIWKEHFPSRIPWEMLPWLFHILLDVPTHPSDVYPTPILWPLSDWKFMSGTSWVSIWIWGANVAALILIYAYLRMRERRAT